MRILELNENTKKDLLGELLKRSPNNYGQYEAAVADIVNAVKERGDEAVFGYTKQFDRCTVTADTVRVKRRSGKRWKRWARNFAA